MTSSSLNSVNREPLVEHDQNPAENTSQTITNSSEYMTEVYREAYNEFSEEIISEEEEEIIEEVTESDYSDDDDYDDDEVEEYGGYYGDDLTYSDEKDSNQHDSESDRHVRLINAVSAGNDGGGGDSNE